MTNLVASFTPGATRNNYSGYVGLSFVVGSSSITVSQLGAMMAATGDTSVVVYLSTASGTVLASATITFGGTVGTFYYTPITPVTLAASTTYYLTALMTSGGQLWANAGNVTLTSLASSPAAIFGGSLSGMTTNSTGQMFVGVDFSTTQFVANVAIPAGGGTSSAINTTGAALLVFSGTAQSSTSPTPSDSLGNTWTELVSNYNGTTVNSLWYVLSPTVGASQTFTYSGSDVCGQVTAWIGVNAIDKNNSAETGSSVSTLQPGSITPSASPALVITSCSQGTQGSSGPTLSVNDGFTISNQTAAGSGNNGGAQAYLIQSTAAAINPTWTVSSNTALAATIASFILIASAEAAQAILESIEQANPTGNAAQTILESVGAGNPAAQTAQTVFEAIYINNPFPKPLAMLRVRQNTALALDDQEADEYANARRLLHLHRVSPAIQWVNITGVGATGHVGSLGISSSLTLHGTSATASPGRLTPEVELAISGVGITSAIGTVGITIELPLIGQDSTSGIGAIEPFVTFRPLTGVRATAGIGTLAVTTGPNMTVINLRGVSAKFGFNTPSVHLQTGLTGVRAISGIGSLNTTNEADGFLMNNLECVAYPMSSDRMLSLRCSTTAGASWQNARTQPLGHTGDYHVSVQFRRLPLARNMIFEISWSGVEATAFTGAFITVEESQT